MCRSHRPLLLRCVGVAWTLRWRCVGVALTLHGSCVMTWNISERVNEEPQSSRGRSKYSTYQSNFKAGRKSSSLMNLCGKRRLSKHRISALLTLRCAGGREARPACGAEVLRVPFCCSIALHSWTYTRRNVL